MRAILCDFFHFFSCSRRFSCRFLSRRRLRLFCGQPRRHLGSLPSFFFTLAPPRRNTGSLPPFLFSVAKSRWRPGMAYAPPVAFPASMPCIRAFGQSQRVTQDKHRYGQQNSYFSHLIHTITSFLKTALLNHYPASLRIML